MHVVRTCLSVLLLLIHHANRPVELKCFMLNTKQVLVEVGDSNDVVILNAENAKLGCKRINKRILFSYHMHCFVKKITDSIM